MDWLSLVLVLLAIVSNIQAQQGYSYPKPKTPFPGDVSTDTRRPNVPSSGSFPTTIVPGGLPEPITPSGAQQPIGSQQPSGGYPGAAGSQRPFGSQQPGGGTTGLQQPSGSYPSQPGITSSGIQRPFGSQQPSGGYPGGPGSQRPFVSQQSTGIQGPTRSQEQPGGYPSIDETSGDVQRPIGTQQPSGGYPGVTRPEISSGGTQSPFGTQQPVGSYPGASQPGTSSDSQRPGTQQPFTGYPNTQQPGGRGDSQRPFGSQQPSTGYPTPSGVSGITQSPFITSFPGGPGVERPTAPERPGLGGQQGTRFPSPTGKSEDRYPGSSAERPQGYNYPTPERPFAGTGSTVSGAEISTTRPGESRFPGFGQVSLSQTRERPGEQGKVTEPAQFPSDRDAPSGTVNGYSTQERPTGFLSGSRPGQQTPSGYPQSGRSQSPFPSGSTEVTPQYPSSSRFPGKQGRDEYSEDGGPAGQFSEGQVGYPGSVGITGNQFPSSGVKQPSGFLRQGSPRGPAGYSQSEKPTGKQFPSSGSDQISEPLGRPGFPERPATSQFPSDRTSAPTGPLQGASGYPTATAPGQQGSIDRFPTIGRPSRPQLPSDISTTSGGKLTPGGYQQSGQQTLRDYLPPGEGTGGLPLSDVQFPSSGFTSSGSRSRPEDGSTSRRLPLEFGRQPGNGFDRTGKQLSSEFPQQPSSSQNGYGSSGRPTSTSGIPSGPRTPSGQQATFPQNGQDEISENGFDRTGKQLSSEFPQQPSSSQNGYGSSGRPTSTSGIPSGSRTPSGQQATFPQNGQDQIRRPFGSQFPTTGRQIESGSQQEGSPKQFGRPQSAAKSEPGYSLDQALKEGFPRRVGGQISSDQSFRETEQGSRGSFTGQQRPLDEEGSFDEEDEGDYSAIPGEPGRDYPILSEVPETSFSCDDQEFRGYYADVETRCQIFHICANNITYDFLCPNGTIFHQENLVCVWWNQFDCNTAPSLYRINEHIYDYSVFGAQQTGGIPMPGQDYPDLPEGPSGFQPGRTPTTGVQIGTQGPGGSERPGYSRYPGQGTQISQRPGAHPSEEPQGSTGFGVPGYPSGGQQETGDHQVPSGRPQITGTGIQGPGKYPSGILQGSRPGYPSSRPQGTGDYQVPSGQPQIPGTGIQRPGSYPSGYQGSSTPSSVGYPSGRPQGTGDYQTPSGQLQGPGIGTQRPGGYPTGEGSQGLASGQGPQGTGQFQYPGVQRPGSGIQRPGGYRSEQSQEPVDSTRYPGKVNERPDSEYSGREPQAQGYPGDRPGSTEPQGSTPGRRPGQYGGDEISRPTLPSVSDTTGLHRPGISSSGTQVPGGYPSGTSPRPGFPSGPQSSVPSESSSLFPGSPQPHQPTREYLPPV